MKYYYEPNDKWYDTKQELVDAWNEDFEGTHSTKVTIDNWTEEQWNTIWKPNMKKLEIKTEKATLLVVDLPTCKTHLFYKGYYVMYSSDKGLNDKCRKISQGDTQGFYYIGTDCKYLGKVSEITEEEWKGIVDDPFVKGIGQYVKPDNLEGWTVVNAAMGVQYQKYSHISFKDYNIKTDGFSIAKQYPFKTAKESGLSLLKANGVVMDYDFEDCQNDFCENGRIYVGYNESMTCSLCEEEQEKVWPNPHVFIKVD